MFPKMVVPQIIHFNRVFHYKPNFGVPLFLETPNWDSNKQGEEEQLDIVFVHVREGAAKQTNLQGLSEL